MNSNDDPQKMGAWCEYRVRHITWLPKYRIVQNETQGIVKKLQFVLNIVGQTGKSADNEICSSVELKIAKVNGPLLSKFAVSYYKFCGKS